MYERRCNDLEDKKTFERWHDVCKPAFDNIRTQFQSVENKLDDIQLKLENKIELNRLDIVLMREKLNNGINDKINDMQKNLNRLFWLIMASAGTIILSAIGFIVSILVGV